MKDKFTAAMLAMFLGTFGAHRFYLGEAGPGCLYLLLGSLVFPLPFLALLGFFEGLALLFMDDNTFNARYNAFKYDVHIHLQPGAQPQATMGASPQTAGHRPPPAAWYKQARARTPAEREQVVLAMALEQGGSITPAELALNTQLSLQQGRDILEAFEAQGLCQTEYDPDTGLARYHFPDLLTMHRMDRPASEDDLLDNTLR